MRNHGALFRLVQELSIVGFMLAFAACSTFTAEAQDRAAMAKGEQVFVDQGCYGCHTIGAVGTPIGPSLSRIGAKYGERDLARWLADPASQKPNAHMPKLDLTPAEISALAAFLAGQR